MIRKKTAKKAARKVAKKTAAKDTAGKTTARKSSKRKSASIRAGRTVRTRKSRNRNLHDLLSRMTFIHACQLLGANGQQLIYQGSSFDEIDIENDVFLGDDLFRLRLPEYRRDGEVPIVTITLMAEKRKRLNFNCTTCGTHCDHIGAALSLILEEKTLLGLAEPPPEEIPFELLSEDKLIEVALSERQSRADTEKFRVKSSDPKTPWTDYVVTSAGSGKSYRVALRGEERGISYCTCPDYRTNSLGTCKHILYALKRVKTKFSAQRRGRKPKRKRFSVHVRHDQGGQLQLSRPHIVDAEAAKIIARIPEGPTDNAHSLVRAITQLQNAGHEVNVYPDAERTIEELLFRKRMAKITGEIRKDPANHPLREELLNATLLPYQLDGIAFAAGRGRAILADDMGLGKTIQGIGVAELLAREANVEKVLVICPTSLKSQWRSEVHRFSGRSVQLVLGSAAERASQYDNDAFLTVCNYEQVLRDILSIDQVQWDLIILDEAQRIKNWQSKTSSVVKSLRSRFALVLSGTPLENRIDELFSVVQFVDDRRLGAGFRFFNRHRIVDITGRVTGYKNLDQLREHLRPILLRRTRGEVLKQLPPRTTDIVRIEPTDEQLEIHGAHRRIVATILRKPYVSEMDMLRMQKALLMCRLAANSTFLIDKQPPGFSSKLDHLDGLLERVAAEPSRKCVLFSEWTRMLELIEPLLEKHGLEYVRLDGSIPQKKRQTLVQRFQTDPQCRFFITTNAGSTGLNLQAANTVINVDLPWNPAILEQRIARAHRMGQKDPVHVYVLVTEDTLEEELLRTLSNKSDLADAALNAKSDIAELDFVSNIEATRRKLEILIGAPCDAPEDTSSLRRAEGELAVGAERQQRVAAAGGELLGAVFDFLGELTGASDTKEAPNTELVASVKQSLEQCVDTDGEGRPQLRVTLPDRPALDKLAETMARLLVPQK